MKIPKDTIGLAGEFAVASELCRRGVYAQLTLGNRKRTDLLVESNACMLRIQVKSKQGPIWPAVRGVVGEDIYLIFADFEKKGPLDRPDFFVLDSTDWATFVQQELVDSGAVGDGKVVLSTEGVPTWSDGFVGMSVKPKQLQPYREQWEKLVERTNGIA